MARQRSTEAHNKVLEAAENLFAEHGIDATSMDAIAANSSVSKATIYKHWADKDQLALEVLSHLHGLDREPVVFDTGNLRSDLIALLRHRPTEERNSIRERIMPHLIAYSARNPVFGRAWRTLVVERQRKQIGSLLQRGVIQGELEKNFDPEIGIALLFGPMAYRHIFVDGKRGQAPKEFVESIVDAFFRAFGRSSRAAAPSIQSGTPRVESEDITRALAAGAKLRRQSKKPEK